MIQRAYTGGAGIQDVGLSVHPKPLDPLKIHGTCDKRFLEAQSFLAVQMGVSNNEGISPSKNKTRTCTNSQGPEENLLVLSCL